MNGVHDLSASSYTGKWQATTDSLCGDQDVRNNTFFFDSKHMTCAGKSALYLICHKDDAVLA